MRTDLLFAIVFVHSDFFIIITDYEGVHDYAGLLSQ